jgi:acetyl esterase/lipase
MPAGLVLISPFLDASCGLAKKADATSRDPFIAPRPIGEYIDRYLGGADRADPRIDLMHVDADGLSPMLLQIGGTECLRPAAEEFARRVNGAGGSCELQVWPGQIHVFQAVQRLVPEADAAIAHVGRFVADALEPVV